MSRTVCGTCWSPYIDGRCDCPMAKQREPAAILTTWISETEAVTEPLYKMPPRLTDAEIGEIWFAARIPGLTETAARVLIRAAERRARGE